MSKVKLFLTLTDKIRTTSPYVAAGFRHQSTVVAPAANTDALNDVNKEWNNARLFEEIPGPKVLPVFGPFLQYIPKIGEMAFSDFGELHERLHEKYGNIYRMVLPDGKNMVAVFDPNWIEKVLRNEGQWPIREGINSFLYYRKVTRKDFFEGHAGLVMEQGEMWQTFRTKVNQPMMQPKTAKLYVAPINEVADDFIHKVYLLRDSNLEMPGDFLNELFKWSLESIAMVALDARLGCLDSNLKQDSEPQKLIDSVQVMFDSFVKLDFKIPFWKYFPTPAWNRFVKAMDYFTEIASKYIYKAVDKLNNKPVDSDEEMTLLERLLARDSNPKTAIIMALDMLMAGIDTTSVAVANTLYHLAKNPEKQELLYQEITRIAPSKETAITGDNLEDMKYLKASFKEVMRLTPVTFGNQRTMINDIVIGNYRIPKGTMVIMPHLILSLKEEYYPEAKKFIPERWMKSRETHSSSTAGGCPISEAKTHPFVTLPFGFGPRMCIGRRFAELEVMILVAKMVQHFKVEYHHGEMTYSHQALSKPMKPLKFRFVERT